jgi:undecaprenyl-diphosphatase
VRTPVTRSTLIAVLAIASLVFIFGLIAQEVATGETSAFDRRLILLLRDPANPSGPIGPAWSQEAALDVNSLGSIVVLVIFTLASVG